MDVVEYFLWMLGWAFASGQGTQPETSQFEYSERYVHENAAQLEVYASNTGDTDVLIEVTISGKESRPVAFLQLEAAMIEFPFAYLGIDREDLAGKELELTVVVEPNDKSMSEESEVEIQVVTRQVDTDNILGDLFVPFDSCRALVGPLRSAAWREC